MVLFGLFSIGYGLMVIDRGHISIGIHYSGGGGSIYSLAHEPRLFGFCVIYFCACGFIFLIKAIINRGDSCQLYC
jgi:hypothetical protein